LPRPDTAEVLELFTDTERPLEAPVSARESRPETDRREARELREVLERELLELPRLLRLPDEPLP
jgi:hypothetical protein